MQNLPPSQNKIYPEFENLFTKALELTKQGDLIGAKNIYEILLEYNQNHFKSLCNLGVISFQTNDYYTAVSLLTKAIEVNPGEPTVHANLGLAYQALGQHEKSIQYYDSAIKLKPELVEAHMKKGLALHLLTRFEEAIISYDLAINLKSDISQLWANRGASLASLNRLEDAISSYDKAINLNPNLAPAHINRGKTLQQINRFEDAIISYYKAIGLNPNLAEIYCNLGYLLIKLNNIEEAIVNCDKAIKLKPNLAEAYANRGNAFFNLRHFDDAISNYDKAISLKPDWAEAYANRGQIFEEFGCFEKAINDYELALKLDLNTEFLIGLSIFAKLKVCDWGNLHFSIDAFKQGIISTNKISSPLVALSFIDDPMLHFLNTKTYSEYLYPKNQCLDQISRNALNEKIRVGYFSSDLFVEHPVSFLTTEFFELQIFAFTFAEKTESYLKQKSLNYFSNIFEVHNKSDKEIAELSRKLGIDIAIDLGGYTKNSRPRIFSYRAAPIQVNFLGYPGTMAADYFDYIISDKTVIPEDNQIYFSEKICYLPHSYMPFDTSLRLSEKEISRIEFGLPENVFIYACFNNSFKISYDLFKSWMRILSVTNDSVLWLSNLNDYARDNLINEAKKWSINSDRIIFANHLDKIEDHLNRHTLADLFLDTSPYNGHTTSLNALWAEIPVLTLIGKSFASRVTASFLNVLGLPELISHTLEDYEAKAIEFFKERNKLNTIKQLIKKNKRTSPLFCTSLLTQHVEAAYIEMHRRNKSDQPPSNLYIY